MKVKDKLVRLNLAGVRDGGRLAVGTLLCLFSTRAEGEKKKIKLQLLKITRFAEVEYTFMRNKFSLDLQ
jgi:hypothetical protein